MCLCFCWGSRWLWSSFFFFNDTATTEIYALSLHDALPFCEGDRLEIDGAGLPTVSDRVLDCAPPLPFWIETLKVAALFSVTGPAICDEVFVVSTLLGIVQRLQVHTAITHSAGHVVNLLPLI